MEKLNKHYFTDLLILALPILVGEIGHTLIGATDILVVARYSIDALASVSIANSILFSIFIFGIGILIAISIILSNKRGAKQGIKKYLLSSLIFSVLMAILFAFICYSTKFLIPHMGFEEKLIPLIQEYIVIASISMFGMFIFEGGKQFLQAYEIVNFPNILLIVAVFVNLIFDILFVFGFGPIPAMGVKGAALATLVVRTFIGLAMFMYIYRFINFKSKIDLSYMKQIFKVGIPIGFALMFEFLAFNIITILVGRESGLLSGIHNILITISSAMFMLPLSISIALSVKVSYYYGANKLEEIKKFTNAALILGVGFMAVAAGVLAIFPSQIIKIFTDNKQVLDIAVPLVGIAAMYQIFDGYQIIMGGVLKGFKMTKFVSWAVLMGYWLCGMPVAILLVYYFDYMLKGYWVALAVSVTMMGVVQGLMAHYKFNKLKEKYTIL